MIINNYPLVVVVPVYEDFEACRKLIQNIAHIFGQRVFLVAVDDGSVRQPLSKDIFQGADIAGSIIKLRRNVGHQTAIAIGLSYIAGRLEPNQRVVVMDSDGEDLPGSINELLMNLDDNAVDVVVATRKRRFETLRFKTFYAFYQLLFKLLSGRAIGFGNFMALKPSAISRMTSMHELSIHVAATVLVSRLRVRTCLLDRGPRYVGHSRMNFVGLALHGFRGLMVFAEDVLVRVGILCAIVTVLCVGAVLVATVLKFSGFATPGWFSVALGILVLIVLQTGVLTLMTLMLTGIARASNIMKNFTYTEFIDRIVAADDVA
jgi:glycosyltransferase involved in cell wall biosynthesis